MKPVTPISKIGEHALLKRYRGRFPLSNEVYFGSGDDTAVLYRDKNSFDLLTTDFVIEGRHFTRPDATGMEIGWKAMARNLSDIAAMGGRPVAAVVALACPPNTPFALLAAIERGLARASRKYACPIVGGDLSTNDKITLAVTIMGRVEKKCLVLRRGAQKGDLILCTGTLGGSIYGKHKCFTPRIKEARFLSKYARPHAMIDISDGLVRDLAHILEASQKGARLFKTQIPLSSAVKKYYKDDCARLDHALFDGEDYELLFTMNSGAVEKLFAMARKQRIQTRFTVIGNVTKDPGIELVDHNGSRKKLEIKGYEHFKA
jgi:thiamine-monophosphate kinase